jgi:CRISPR-associated protein (TIGR03986 family)
VPYTNKLGDLLPEGLRRTADPPDVCQGLFGDVLGTTAIRRRITVSHAVLLDPPSRLAASELDPIRVGLLAPNRQSYALYLTQRQPNRVDALRDFDGDLSGGVAEPRGFKLYPHRQGDENPPALPPSQDVLKEWESDIVPLRPGLVFRCRVRFTNLSAAEIGLLLRAVLLANEPGAGATDPVSAHKLGRGRPLGLGGVHLEPTLHLLDPAVRYTGNTDGFERVDDLAPYLATWDKIAVRHAQVNGEDIVDGTGWQRVARLRELVLATSWRGRLAPASLAQMKEVKDFAEDRVLPGLLHLFGMA